MSFAAIAAYLRPEYPQYTADEQSLGNVYQYRGPTATILANRPNVGDAWADGRAVRSVEYTPGIDNSGYSDLIVSSVYNIAETETISSEFESERYQIRWVPNDQPLVQHPEFLPGGTFDLSEVFTDSRTGYEEVNGWELEEDVSLKRQYKYKRIISGQSTGSAIDMTPASTQFAKYRLLGFDSFTVFLPVWTKVSVYSGTVAPGTGAAGQYAATPSGSGYPSGYQWIKSADTAERIGTKAKWNRTEEWTGFKKVYFDTDSLNPASNTLP
jgi:hypothetical protein